MTNDSDLPEWVHGDSNTPPERVRIMVHDGCPWDVWPDGQGGVRVRSGMLREDGPCPWTGDEWDSFGQSQIPAEILPVLVAALTAAAAEVD